MNRKKVTAIIPTFNEEIHIESAIQSVRFADEIIVLDSFSTDNTIALAKKHSVKVIQRVFDDFSSQKNYAISKAKNNWIYVLDADERVSKELKKEIIHVLNYPNQKVGFYIFRTFYFLDKKVNYGGWQRDKVIRLFRKDKCKYNGNLVHEKIKYNGEIGIFKNKIDHFSYRSYKQYWNKLDHYASLKARDLFNKKSSVHLFHLYIKPPVRFFIDYFLKLGILDGKKGVTLALLQSRGVKARYTKLKHLYDSVNKK